MYDHYIDIKYDCNKSDLLTYWFIDCHVIIKSYFLFFQKLHNMWMIERSMYFVTNWTRFASRVTNIKEAWDLDFWPNDPKPYGVRVKLYTTCILQIKIDLVICPWMSSHRILKVITWKPYDLSTWIFICE